MWTIIDYLYRDAGNFKAFGCVALAGRIDAADRKLIHAKFDSGEYFIAEQLGLPPLYEQLYRWSDGPTESDHCWHEFVDFRECDVVPPDCMEAGSAAEFVDRIAAIKDWDLALSRHYGLD